MKEEKPGKMPTSEPLYGQFPISERDLCRAWIEVCEVSSIKNEDAPTERDLLNVRDELGGCFEHISLSWIRNKIVYLRKATKIKGYRESRERR
jgi:hypothetical protein